MPNKAKERLKTRRRGDKKNDRTSESLRGFTRHRVQLTLMPWRGSQVKRSTRRFNVAVIKFLRVSQSVEVTSLTVACLLRTHYTDITQSASDTRHSSRLISTTRFNIDD